MLSKERIGRFTASGIHRLMSGSATWDKYVFEKAEEVVRGHAKQFSNRHTEHGHLNEFEAIENFSKVTGLIVESLDQEYFPITENFGATPDAKVVDFSNKILASVDVKCPTEKFYEQKMMMINESKPAYQNVPKEYFFQAQAQMLALKVKKHYLVRYMTNTEVDFNGNKIEYGLPLEARIFYKVIVADQKVQVKLLDLVTEAAKQRDELVKIFKAPIL